MSFRLPMLQYVHSSHTSCCLHSRVLNATLHAHQVMSGKVPCCRNGAQKLLGVLITIGEAVAYVVSGMYGDVRELGAGNAVLIILQVCSACLVTASIHKAAAHVSPDAPNLLSHAAVAQK